jgi:hypothetical protein
MTKSKTAPETEPETTTKMPKSGTPSAEAPAATIPYGRKSIGQKRRGSIGRPKAETVRDRFVSFRISEEELVRLIAKAQRSGMSPGEYARSRTLRGIARGRKQAELPEIDEALHRLLYEACKHGVNLNQIAHHCNRHQVPPPEGFADLVMTLNGIWDRVKAAL